VVLQFTGLSRPAGVAVDGSGAVYVADTGNNRVVKLASDSPTQSVPALTGLNGPVAVALDVVRNVFVADANNTQVLWADTPRSAATPPWQATATNQWAGPFSGLQAPRGVGIDNGGYYVVDSGNNRVLNWDTGMNAPLVEGFTGLNNPDGVAVNSSPFVWVVDTGNNRVLRLESKSSKAQDVLAFTGLNNPHGIAVSSSNIVFVTDSGNNRVVKLTTDSSTKATTQTILPFAGLNNPTGIAVDGNGNLYVVDSGNNRVLKLDKAFVGQ
jgi:DNA-binding beta-propeller fold protein YncE